MNNIDIFYGDADGICALIQLRSVHPLKSELITGVKRDTALVRRAKVSAGDKLTVLDVSLDKNRGAVDEALTLGAEIFYVDHHFAGAIPISPNFRSCINTSPDVCTSLLVNQHLSGQRAIWAVVGAFGDNLKSEAVTLAQSLELSASDASRLEALGIYLNYNSYGSSLEDLHFDPRELFQGTVRYESPLDFLAECPDIFQRLETGYRDDMLQTRDLSPHTETPRIAVFQLPNEAWARRVSGVLGNDLANKTPGRAHAVITEADDGNFLVSVRAPLNNKAGADEVCRQFPTGGGRKAAAGINSLPASMVPEFVATFAKFYA